MMKIMSRFFLISIFLFCQKVNAYIIFHEYRVVQILNMTSNKPSLLVKDLCEDCGDKFFTVSDNATVFFNGEPIDINSSKIKSGKFYRAGILLNTEDGLVYQIKIQHAVNKW